MILKIGWSARRHGVADEDIEHAVSHAMAVGDQDDELRLYLGPARDADLIEVVVVMREDRYEVAIHAMRMRSKYRQFLSGG